ncbi:MAG: nucleotidyltransferase family protein [Bacteroidaceae bacterium]|nr:nucleotidyltransferase family protein [Bacteroidaceae bacterium]
MLKFDILFYILAISVNDNGLKAERLNSVLLSDLYELYSFAKGHAVEGLLAEAILEGNVELKCSQENLAEKRYMVLELAKVQQQNRAVMRRFDDVLTEVALLLQKERVDFVIFKGIAVASFYSCPSARTMGDIDFYVPSWDYDRALDLLEKVLGVKVERCDVDKHDAFCYKGIRFEMHYQMETFGAERHQRYFSVLVDESIRDGRIGNFTLSGGVQVPMLEPTVDLILVFKHMFNHFIGEGVGLRQVTDVIVLIKAYAKVLNIDLLRQHLKAIGYLKVFDAMVALAVKYFMLSWPEYQGFLNKTDYKMGDKLMTDVLCNGNFGRLAYKNKSGWGKRIETSCRFLRNCAKYFWLAPWEICCLLPKRVMISLRAH